MSQCVGKCRDWYGTMGYIIKKLSGACRLLEWVNREPMFAQVDSFIGLVGHYDPEFGLYLSNQFELIEGKAKHVSTVQDVEGRDMTRWSMSEMQGLFQRIFVFGVFFGVFIGFFLFWCGFFSEVQELFWKRRTHWFCTELSNECEHCPM